MSLTIVNSIPLDYSLLRNYKIPYTKTVNFQAGGVTPKNNNLVYAFWDFGDGITEITSLYNTLTSTYLETVSELQQYSDFFPAWEETLTRSITRGIPKFNTTHTYTSPGVYEASVVLVDNKGVGYRGKSQTITITEDRPPYTVPKGWLSLSQSYTESDSVYTLFTNGLPELVVNTQSISSLPIPATFKVTNLVGRVDVDFIEWNFGDGTSHVVEVLQSPVLEPYCEINYSYPILSFELSYKPTVTIYFNKNGVRQKCTIRGQDVILQDRTNITVDAIIKGSAKNSYNFNIQPINSITLPVETSFFCNVTNGLRYIIWDHDDGTFDYTTVAYNSSASNIKQVVEHKHTYTSVNYNKYFPSCIYVYQKADGTFYTERLRSWSALNYDLGIINPRVNYFSFPVYSVTSYSKFNNIHVLTDYTAENQADVKIRLSLDFPEQILLFEKIIWNINGQEFVQDKNTSEKFGYLTLRNIVTPYENFSIIARLYGYPNIFNSAAITKDLNFFDTYSYRLTIPTRSEQEAINANNLLSLNVPRVIIPATTVTEISGGVEITTPVVDQQTTQDGTLAPAFSSRTFTFDRLFEALNPAANFLNRLYPSVASIFGGNLATRHEIGYFRPSKATNIVVDPGQFTFLVNFDVVENNSYVYFPDPFKYGSNTNALTFNVQDSSFKKGFNLSIAKDEPDTNDDSVSFYGYNSKKQQGKYTELSYLYDQGYVHDIKHDIYGNSYGLIKNNNNFRKNIVIDPPQIKETVLFNGYKFYDTVFNEGFAFNFLTERSDGFETIAPGLSTYTNSFNYATQPFNVRFGTFKRTIPLSFTHPIDVEAVYLNPPVIGYRDAGVFMIDDNTPIIDASSDSNLWPGIANYYYTELFEAGGNYSITGEYERPNTIVPSSSAQFDFIFRPPSFGLITTEIIDADCGLFVSIIPSFEDIVYNGIEIISLSGIDPSAKTLYTSTSSIVESLIARESLSGKLVIRNKNNQINTLFEALPYLQTKYPSSVLYQLSSNIKEFDVVYDTYFALTSSYLVIDKILLENNTFVTPSTPNNIVTYNTDTFNKISNRFKQDDNVYFSTLSSTYISSVYDLSSFCIVPNIYKYNITTNTLSKVFPDNTTTISDFGISDTVKYVSATTPSITYSEELNLFNLSYLLKDIADGYYLVSINFTEQDKININSIKGYPFTNTVTIMFNKKANNASTLSQILTSDSIVTTFTDYTLL